MIVVSIDRQTGDLASISVPRNLKNLPMPAGPLRKQFPGGFNDLANALYPYVSTHPGLGLDPCAVGEGRRWPSCSASRSTTTCSST